VDVEAYPRGFVTNKKVLANLTCGRFALSLVRKHATVWHQQYEDFYIRSSDVLLCTMLKPFIFIFCGQSITSVHRTCALVRAALPVYSGVV